MSTLRRSAAWLCAAVLISVTIGCDRAQDQPWSTRDLDATQLAESQQTSSASTDAAQPSQTAEPRQRAIEILLAAAESDSPQLRANAMEALQHVPERLEPIVRQGLVDDNRGVRFGAAMMVGRMQMRDLAHLLEPLLDDESESVRAAAMFGMHACGQPVDLNPLADMIRSDSPEVRANAALVLGELGNQSAAGMIRAAVGRGMQRVSPARIRIVELQMAEAMVRLGDERQLEVIRAALFSPAEQGEVTALACMICGDLRDERAVPNLLRIAHRQGRPGQPAEVRMAATMAVAQIATGEAPAEVPLEYMDHSEPAIRAQAASTMGYMRNDEPTARALTSLLDDDAPLVQVAAAGAVLRRAGGGAS